MNRYIAFCRILDCGSFTAAAESLGYTQAAISQMIRSLEAELSLKLLIRTRSGVRLTPEGEVLYPLIRTAVNDCKKITDRAEELHGLDAGEIRIGAFPSLSQHFLTRLMRDFGQMYPHVRFTLHMGDNKTLPEWVKAGLIDLAFVYPETAAGLSHKTIFSDEFLAILPLSHPLSERSILPLEALAGEPLILVEEGSNVNTVLNRFSERGITPDVKYRIHDDYTILSMVEQGLGVSILPAMILDRTMYRFARVPTEPPIRRTVALAYNHRDLLPVAAKLFMDFMLSHLSDYLTDDYTTVLYGNE